MGIDFSIHLAGFIEVVTPVTLEHDLSLSLALEPVHPPQSTREVEERAARDREAREREADREAEEREAAEREAEEREAEERAGRDPEPEAERLDDRPDPTIEEDGAASPETIMPVNW